jgi:mannonate dehydratase
VKPGLGLYREMLSRQNFRFARQIGAEAVVVHLVDYFANRPTGSSGWGITNTPLWTRDELSALRRDVEAEGLELAAIENLDPSHWHDVLLDGPQKTRQLEDLKKLIRRVGEAGIPVIGYNFSLAGIWGQTMGPFARGGARSAGYSHESAPVETPIPNGMVWNMTYDANAPSGTVGPVSEDEMWGRLEEFLRAVVPVAEECGVKLALHPDDPPLPVVRGTARIATDPARLQRVIDLVPSSSNTLELCQGTLAEMPGIDLYGAIEQFARQKKIGYVHFRNVRGKLPHYEEDFVDAGDVDMARTLAIYKRESFDGVVIPDHTPQVECDAPWHAGMAYALGYVRALLRSI